MNDKVLSLEQQGAGSVETVERWTPPSSPPHPDEHEVWLDALETSAAIADLLAVPEPPALVPLLQAVADLIYRRHRYDGIGIHLVDEKEDLLRPCAWAGRADDVPGDGDLAVDPSDALVRAVIERRPLVERTARGGWQMAVPLEAGLRILGVLEVRGSRPEDLHPTTQRVFRALARQIAAAIHQVRAYSDLSRTHAALERAVTELRRQTRALRVTTQQFKRQDRAKSDFITAATQELRAPLTVLSGYSRMLLTDPAIEGYEYREHLVKGIQGSAERLRTIVDDVLDMVRIDNHALQLHPEPVRPIGLIRAIHSTLDPILSDRKVLVQLDESLNNLPVIEADTEGMRKVFTHLMVNAVQTTPDGGIVRVWGRRLPDGHATAGDVRAVGHMINQDTDTVQRTAPQLAVEVVVSDTGMGLDPGAQERIFAKTHRTGTLSAPPPGSNGPGLGWAIARGIVEAHGGRIWAESPGQDETRCPGSDFHVILPLHPELGPPVGS